MVHLDLAKYDNNEMVNQSGFSLKFGYFSDTDKIAYVYSFRDKEIDWYNTFDEVPDTFKKSMIDYYYEIDQFEYRTDETIKLYQPSTRFEKNDIIITSKYGEEFIILCTAVNECDTKFKLFINGVVVKETYNLEVMIKHIMGVK